MAGMSRSNRTQWHRAFAEVGLLSLRPVRNVRLRLPRQHIVAQPMPAIIPSALPSAPQHLGVSRVTPAAPICRMSLAIGVLLLSACGGAGDSGTGPVGSGVTGRGGTVATLVLRSGNAQEAEVETPLGQPIVVRATNALGAPVGGVTVAAGGASAGGEVSPASATTANDGTASFTWRLGSTEGAQSVTLQAGTAPPVSVTATGTPVVRTLEVVGGPLTGEAGGPTSQPLVVLVRRARDRAVQSGQRVRVGNTTGGTVSPSELVSGSDGTAAFQWTLGPSVQPQVTTLVLTAAPTVTASATANVTPEQRTLQVVGGNNQTGEFGATLSDSIQIRLIRTRDATPIANTVVTFSVSAEGGTTSMAAATTNAEGRAVVQWRLGTASQSELSVNVASTPVSSAATQTVRAFAVPEKRMLRILSGDKQSGEFRQTLPDSIVVQLLRLRDSTPIANVMISFSVSASSGTLTTYVQRSDRFGKAGAVWSLGLSRTPSIIIRSEPTPLAAEAMMEITASARPEARVLSLKSGDRQRGVYGQYLPAPLVYKLTRVRDGIGVARARIEFVALQGSGRVDERPSTDDYGELRVWWQLGKEVQHSLRAEAVASEVSDPASVIASAMADPNRLGIGFGDEQFALISAGTFIMGAGENDGFSSDRERPAHLVRISNSFRIQKTEVTWGQWREVMGGVPAGLSSCGNQCPVENVSWYEVHDFLARLNARDPRKGYRLPTEAEWEYAARAGSTGPFVVDGPLCGIFWSSYSCNPSGAREVALGIPNAWGIFDVQGNASEMVQDWDAAYSPDAVTDPVGPSDGYWRVIRGGSWTEGYSAVTSRGGLHPGDSYLGMGFRLVRRQ